MLKRSKSKVLLKSAFHRPDWLLIFLVLGLTIFGVIMVGNASVVEAYRDFAGLWQQILLFSLADFLGSFRSFGLFYLFLF
ncbi:MAG: hypothetical protein NTV20_00080 [Candidatus Shapirobacteria bacterium]|nr:hypothetical protein [Candidatus Shapirobacteria bacterium]